MKVNTINKTTGELESYGEQAAIQSGIEITDEVLDKINKFSASPIVKESVVAYPVLLIDDKVTRNNTHYPKEFQKMLLSLPIGEGNVIGASLLLGTNEDHQGIAASQIGRIYDATQVVDKEGHYGILGHAYMLKSSNQETIDKIDSGIFKEVSISTKVEMPICSICHQDIRECDHKPGKDGCYISMSGKGFCAECSIVAIPGSNSAKILSADKLKEYKTVTETLINDKLTTMEEKYNASVAKIEGLFSNLPAIITAAFKEMGSSLVPASGLIQAEQLNETLKGSIVEMEKSNKELLATIEAMKVEQSAIVDREYKEKMKLIDETVRLGVLAKSIKFDGKDATKKLLTGMNIDEITSIKESFNTEAVKLYPKMDVVVAEEVVKGKEITTNSSTVNVMDFKK